MVSTPASSLNILFFFSVYIIAILDFTSLNVNSKRMLFLLPRHFLSPGPQPSDAP